MVLEFGCGAAQWAIALAGQGGDTTGLDNEHARGLTRAARVDFPLVHASAEWNRGWKYESFDVVFCDYGAMTFADPRLTVPERPPVAEWRPARLLGQHTRHRHGLATRRRAPGRPAPTQLLGGSTQRIKSSAST